MHMTQSDPRLAVLRKLTHVDDDDLWLLLVLKNLDAVDPLRQPVSIDAVEAPPPPWTAAKERVLRQLAYLQPRADSTDAERQLWSEIRREAFPEGSDE
jgi:hypothetical protein